VAHSSAAADSPSCEIRDSERLADRGAFVGFAWTDPSGDWRAASSTPAPARGLRVVRVVVVIANWRVRTVHL